MDVVKGEAAESAEDLLHRLLARHAATPKANSRHNHRSARHSKKTSESCLLQLFFLNGAIKA